MEEKQAFQWTPDLEATFQTVKEALCTSSILAYPQPREGLVVDRASHVGIRGALSQIQDGRERVIVYYSKTLNKTERSYHDYGF
jgi:hypothetical protein